MVREIDTFLSGELLDEETQFDLVDLCRLCQVPSEVVMALVDQGVVEPLGDGPTRWRFHAISVTRVRSAVRLERDLGVNAAGVALALDLLDELEVTRSRLRQLVWQESDPRP